MALKQQKSPILRRKRLRRGSRISAKSAGKLATVFTALFVLAILATLAFLVVSVARIALQLPVSSLEQHKGGAKIHFSHDKQEPPTPSPVVKFSRNTPQAPACQGSFVDISFTLVTQLSMDRIWMMEHHCQRWSMGPISVAVLTNQTLETVENEMTQLGCDPSLLTVSIYSPNNTTYEELLMNYPVNGMRNLALSRVVTSHILLIDIDFWPSVDLWDVLQQEAVLVALENDPRLAVVIPAFQLQRPCREWRDCREQSVPLMPYTRHALMEGIQDHQCTMFDPTNRGGHGSTRYRDWFRQPPNQLVEIDCFHSHRYEPYVALRYCRDLPPFQELFTGYGKNKMSWTMQLRLAGYRFSQCSGFLVHYPHLDSVSRMEWNKKPPQEEDTPDWSQSKRGQVDQVFVDFRDWLETEYDVDEVRVPLCDDVQDDDAKLWIDHHRSSSERDTNTSRL